METVYSANNEEFSSTVKSELPIISVKQEQCTDLDGIDSTREDGSVEENNFDADNVKLELEDVIVKEEMDLSALIREFEHYDWTNVNMETKNGEPAKEPKDINMLCCLLCKEATDIHGNNICDPCRKMHQQNLEVYMTRDLGSCLVCMNAIRHREQRTKHDCTLVNAFVCFHCNSVFSDKSQLIKHIEERYDRNACLQCNTSFCSRSEIKSHACVSSENVSSVNRNTSSSNFICDFCQKQLSTRNSLKEHVMCIHGIVPHLPNNNKKMKKMYKCDKCNKSFSHPHNLSRHLNTHENKRIYKCTNCDKCFLRSDYLKEHNLSIHRIGNKNYKCPHCQKYFSKLIKLKRHLLVVENKRSYKCTFCNKRFNLPEYLKSHLCIHDNKRAYKCTYCKYACIDLKDLNKHLARHENKRNFKCKYCEYTANTSDDLNKHLAIHENKGKYRCTYCTKSFYRSGHLKSHLRVHNKKRKNKH